MTSQRSPARVRNVLWAAAAVVVMFSSAVFAQRESLPIDLPNGPAKPDSTSSGSAMSATATSRHFT